MRVFRPILGLGLLLLVLGVAPADAGEADRITYSESGYVCLDPARIRTPNDERLVLGLYDGLTAIEGRTGKVVPAAAERWEESPDGLTWTFKLRPRATWSDGSPVTASDFVAAWKRLIDPYEPSPWTPLLRPLGGCATISDGHRAMDALNTAAKGLSALITSHGSGIPGRDLNELLERSSVRRYAADLDDPAVKKMLRWGSDTFPTDRAKAAVSALKKERRRWKKTVYDTFDEFGTTVGVKATDARTLVVMLEGRCPYLPALCARAPLVPIHEKNRTGSETAFAPEELLANGAFVLKARGAKARPGVPNPESAVHLETNPRYQGPRPGAMPEILCFTDLGADEDLRRLEVGVSQWLANPELEQRKALVKMAGYQARPAGRLVLLRFRADRKPFDDERVRRAFAMAVDRKRLARELWPTPKEASRLVPAASGGTAPRTDVKAAKALLQKAGIEVAKLPWVELQIEDRNRLLDVGEELLRQWEKGIGLEMGIRLEMPGDARRMRQAGAYHVSLGVLDAAARDPAAWILPLGGDRPDGSLGWDDDGFEALLEAARDVDGLLKGGDEAIQKLPNAETLRATVEAARRGAPARERLRLALLEAAGTRALEACIVVPLLWPARASVETRIKELGSRAAWEHPAFYGDLRRAHR